MQVARNYTAQTLMLANASQGNLTQYDVITVAAMEGIGVAAAMEKQQQTSGIISPPVIHAQQPSKPTFICSEEVLLHSWSVPATLSRMESPKMFTRASVRHMCLVGLPLSRTPTDALYEGVLAGFSCHWYALDSVAYPQGRQECRMYLSGQTRTTHMSQSRGVQMESPGRQQKAPFLQTTPRATSLP